MLEHKIFLQGINYLKANYINWGFDLSNDLMLKVWYKKVSNLDASLFMQLVERYTDTNKYAPNSPAELLAVLDEQLFSKELGANEAWGRLREIRQKYPLCYYYDDEKEKYYTELEQLTPALKQTAIEYEEELYCGRDDGYFIDQFKKAYVNNLKKLIDQRKCKLLGVNNILLLN